METNKKGNRRKRDSCYQCTVELWRKDTILCKRCEEKFCESHMFKYVDGNNIAITQNSPWYCKPCYLITYPNDWCLREDQVTYLTGNTARYELDNGSANLSLQILGCCVICEIAKGDIKQCRCSCDGTYHGSLSREDDIKIHPNQITY